MLRGMAMQSWSSDPRLRPGERGVAVRLPQAQNEDEMRTVGLVLGAGGAVGRAFHVGALAALEEVTGWDPRDARVVVGTSAGSIVGALLRAGMSARDYCAWTVREPVSAEAAAILQRFGGRSLPPTPPRRPESWWPAAPRLLLRAVARPWRFRLGAVAAAAMPQGAVRLDGLVEGFESTFGSGWPARPLWICAVSLESGARVVFGREGGPAATVAEAVAASCAIPGWFAPVRIGGVRYVDGGAHSFTNADVVAPLGLDVVVVSSPMSTAAAFRASADGALRAAAHLSVRRACARLRAAGTRTLLLEPDADDVRAMGAVRDAMDPARRAAVARHVRASMSERLRASPANEIVLRDLAPPAGPRHSTSP
jgi:NTE family protein